MIQSFILMTQEQRDAAEALNDSRAMLGSRQINNPLANNVGLGELLGKWIATAHVLIDPDYTRWWESLSEYPIHLLDTDVIFIQENLI